MRWYGVLIMGGAILAAILAARRAQARGIHPDHVWNQLLLGRLFTEGLRTDSLCIGPYTADGSCAGGLRIAQVVSLSTVIGCGLILALRHRRPRWPEETAATG